MQKLRFFIPLVLFFNAQAQTIIEDNEINFQDIFLFKNAKSMKMLEVEDGPFNKGRKVQEYFPYAKNGLTDGYNQQWLIIPAGTCKGRNVYHLINYGFLKFLSSMDPVVVEEGNGADDELWVFERMGQNWLIKSYLGNVYLQIPDGAYKDGEAFTLGNFNGSLTQQFIMTRYAGQTGPPPAVSSGIMNIMTAYNDSKLPDASGAADR